MVAAIMSLPPPAAPAAGRYPPQQPHRRPPAAGRRPGSFSAQDVSEWEMREYFEFF